MLSWKMEWEWGTICFNNVTFRPFKSQRYAFMGPMETIHLNAEGTQNYCDRYGDTIYNVSSDLGPIPTGWK